MEKSINPRKGSLIAAELGLIEVLATTPMCNVKFPIDPRLQNKSNTVVIINLKTLEECCDFIQSSYNLPHPIAHAMLTLLELKNS